MWARKSREDKLKKYRIVCLGLLQKISYFIDFVQKKNSQKNNEKFWKNLKNTIGYRMYVKKIFQKD